MQESSPLVYAGTSGLVLPVPNKAAFPPAYRDQSRLTYYASLFNTLEVNSSFYKIPMAATVARWRDSVPDGFRFTFKLWRGITHTKGLHFDPADIYRYMDVIGEAGAKKGCLLIQLPASITAADGQQLQQLLETIRAAGPGQEWRVSVEFRHPSWYAPGTYRLLHKYTACLVTHDMPPAIPAATDAAAGWAYLRLHGPEGGYRGSYSPASLQRYAATIHSFMADGITSYVYFNNTADGDAVANLQQLQQLLGREAAPANGT